MTYGETLDYLYNTLPMFSRMGSAAFKKDLTNIRQLCAALDHPEQRFKSVHVGGTNGKGSVSHMLAAVLQTAGYKTGLYTSPHLYDFRERIRLNGEMISEEEVILFTAQVKPLIEAIQPSFFEITVAMAFDFFARQQVDIAIIEVGLGGRLDSTNIITPALSVITNIGWDHMNMLGNSLAEIAAEKAGIIKPFVPVIIGETAAETRAVFEEVAHAQAAPISFAEEKLQAVGSKSNGFDLAADFQTADGIRINLTTDLPGLYQVKNLRTALVAIDTLVELGWEISEDQVADGLRQVKDLTGLRGRWEVVHERPLVVLDVAHNSNGIREVLFHLSTLNYKQLHIVIGTVNDKDISGVLSLLPNTARYYFTQAQIPRALSSQELRAKSAEFNLQGETFPNVNEAIAEALKPATPLDMVFVCGSIFLIAEVDRSKISTAADQLNAL